MNVLVACEESQRVCIEFRKRGHAAFSCDIRECSGGFPEWHIQGDVIPLLNGCCSFETMTGEEYFILDKWDLIIAHPPCTYMSNAGARWMYQNGKINNDRLKLALQAKEFFMTIYNADCDKIVIENSTPLKIVDLPPHTQVIQPYYFGDPYSKRTLLWLKGVQPLKFTNVCDKHVPYLPSNTGGKKRGETYHKGVVRGSINYAKTFPGIARAMAEQWGNYEQTKEIQ